MPAEPIVPFHTYLWKIASRCNLNCTYCYVYNRGDSRWRRQPKFMTDEVAYQTATRMREHCEAHEKESASIIFHGGEPLLGGLDHLMRLAGIIAEVFADSETKLTVGMQSNGLLFTPEIGDFMRRAGISVGVSIDGPPEVNDRNRVDHAGRGSSNELERRLRLLTEEPYREVFDGFLCVIDPTTDPVRTTDYLLGFDPPGIDFLLPLDNHDRRPPGKEDDLDAAPYGDWLVRAFDRWIETGTQTRVRIFNSIIGLLCGRASLVESLGLEAIDLVVVETNGEIEAVDSLKAVFEGASELGYNVFDHPFDLVARHAGVKARQLGVDSLAQACRECPVVDLCGGGYLPHRYSAERGFDNPSVYSSDLKRLITHIAETIQRELAAVPA
jgi:uncharacterized protein